MGVIELKGVSKSFGKRVVLDNVNLSIEKGTLLGVLGSSGSGKSVLIKVLMGFIKPNSGTIKRNAEIGFSMQNNSFYENLTLIQNLNYFARLYEVKDRKKKIDQLLGELSLLDYKKTLVANISGGTRKRADLACALINSPEVLILDEPFAGLDTFLVNQLSEILRSLQSQGITIILSSHLLNQVENLCNDFVFINSGKVSKITKQEVKKLYQNG